MLTALVTPEAQRRQDQEHPDPMEVEATTLVVQQLPMLPVLDPPPASLRTYSREVLSASQQLLHGTIRMATMAILTLRHTTTTTQSTAMPGITRPIIP